MLRDKQRLKNHTPVSLPLEVNWVCALLPLGDSVLPILFHFSTLVPCGWAALVHHHIQALTRHKFTEEEEEGAGGGGRRGTVLRKESAKFTATEEAEQFGCQKKKNETEDKHKTESFSSERTESLSLSFSLSA